MKPECVLTAGLNACTTTTAAVQQLHDNSAPLRLERIGRLGPPGAVIPVTRVAEVSLLPVQVRVHPRAASVADILCDRVRCIPVSARVVPHRTNRGRDPRWPSA